MFLNDKKNWKFILREIGLMLIPIVLFLIYLLLSNSLVYFYDLSILGMATFSNKLIIPFCAIVLIIGYIFGTAYGRNSRRWISVPIINYAIQPSEFVKLLTILFLSKYIEKMDFLDGTDFQWQKDLYTDSDKKYRAVYLSKQYKTKVIWSLHPNSMWRKGLCKEDTDNLIHFLANSLNEL